MSPGAEAGLTILCRKSAVAVTLKCALLRNLPQVRCSCGHRCLSDGLRPTDDEGAVILNLLSISSRCCQRDLAFTFCRYDAAADAAALASAKGREMTEEASQQASDAAGTASAKAQQAKDQAAEQVQGISGQH